MVLGAPRGKAIYARGDLLEAERHVAYLRQLGANWDAIQPAHVRRGIPAALKAARIPWWLFSTPQGDSDPATPDSWTPSQYARTIPAFEATVLANGGKGYIADTETGWGSASDAQVRALGQALIESRKRTGLSIGLTTFYAHRLWRRLPELVPGIGRYVWLSLQMYQERTPAENARILEEVKRAGWSTHVPSVAAYRWVVGPGNGDNFARARTPAEWNAAYAAFPLVRGAVIWYAVRPEEDLLATIAGWKRWTLIPLDSGHGCDCSCGHGGGDSLDGEDDA